MNKTLTQKTLKELVIKEVKNLKKNATLRELSRLDFDFLNPESERNCIYGQMTGSCFSLKADRLIKKCCKQAIIPATVAFGYDMDESKEFFGNPNTHKGNREKGNFVAYYSPLELFIFKKRNRENGNNEKIIKFLKGETKKLTLK